MLEIYILLVILVCAIAICTTKQPGVSKRYENSDGVQFCAWCGKPILDVQHSISRWPTPRSAEHRRLSHLECEEQAYARHRRYYLGFLVMAIMAALIIVSGTLSELAHTHKPNWNHLFLCMTAVISVFWLPQMIRRVIEPWKKEISEAKERMETE